MVGQLSGDLLDGNVIKTVLIQNAACGIVACHAVGSLDAIARAISGFYLHLRIKCQKDGGENDQHSRVKIVIKGHSDLLFYFPRRSPTEIFLPRI